MRVDLNKCAIDGLQERLKMRFRKVPVEPRPRIAGICCLTESPATLLSHRPATWHQQIQWGSICSAAVSIRIVSEALDTAVAKSGQYYYALLHQYLNTEQTKKHSHSPYM